MDNNKYDKIRQVLTQLNLPQNTTATYFERCCQCVYVLLDYALANPMPAMRAAVSGATIRDGAGTHMIAEQIRQQFGLATRPDREGRDYWIKPLIELGVLEKGHIRADKGQATVLMNYHYPKSANNFYRVSNSFEALLNMEGVNLERAITEWQQSNERAQLQAMQKLASGQLIAASAILNRHDALLNTALEQLAPHYLPGYEPVFVDAGDGQRIEDRWLASMADAGISLTLADRFPDAILWSRSTDTFWFIDAVEHDGEYDQSRVADIIATFAAMGKQVAGFTTVYRDWRTTAKRQSTYKNLAVGTTLWIVEDGGKVFEVKSADRR